VVCAVRVALVALVEAEPNCAETAKLFAAKQGVADRIRTIWAEEFPSRLLGELFELMILEDIIEHIPDDKVLPHSLTQC
jgi:hypothetical protein